MEGKMKLRKIWNEKVKQLRWENAPSFSYPILIRFCENHSRWEWYDPCECRGGIAPTLDILKKTLIQTYQCPSCSAFHVSSILLIEANIVKKIDFVDFVLFDKYHIYETFVI